MTNICRLFAFLLLFSASSFAQDRSDLWSNEFLPFSITDEAPSPFYWGISWSGNSPRVENEDRLFSLGSVKKVITSATALRQLGSDFRFANEFTGDLDEVQGVLFSPVFSVSGDPTWAHPSYDETLTSRIAKVILELKKAKIKRVSGEIKINLLSPALAQFHRPAEWKNSWLLQCYAALPTTVALNGNCAELAIYSRKNIAWATPGVSTPIVNNLVSSSQNSMIITPSLDSMGRVEKYVVSGGFNSTDTIAIPVHANEGWLKNIFIQELRRSGIIYEVQSRKFFPSKTLIPLYVDLSSVPLKEILIPFMQESINLVGDRLHIEAPDDFATLATLISDPTEYQNVTLLDGSGLIGADQISPKTLLHVMSSLRSQPYFQDFFAGLPISGVNGTLQNRMNDPFLKGRVHAKTGTLDGVANLAGYWVKLDQSIEPFVIFTESGLPASSARSKIDDLVAQFARKN